MKTKLVKTVIRLYGGPLDGQTERVTAEYNPIDGGFRRQRVYEFHYHEPSPLDHRSFLYPKTPRARHPQVKTAKYREVSPFERDYVYMRET